MKHLFHGIVECVQESCIMVQHGIMNRFVYNIYEETPIISFAHASKLLVVDISEQFYSHVSWCRTTNTFSEILL